MWTPRRILMIVIGLVCFSGGFTVYARLFGWIDGLPPLPDGYTKKLTPDSADPPPDQPLNPLQTRLRQAFGPNCVEQSQLYKLKFESREKGVLFAACDWQIMDDGRVQIQQMSVAVFGKTSKEMTTVHCDRAILLFDQPVRRIDDMGTRKIKAAELYADADYPTDDPRKGKVQIVNNRKTLDPDDDLILLTPGPVYYVESPRPGEPHITTPAFIELTDRQNRPLPTQAESEFQLPTVTALGARVYLKNEPPTPPKSKKQEHKQASAVSGVDRIDLERQVSMNIWTEGSMLGGPPAPGSKAKSVPPKSGNRPDKSTPAKSSAAAAPPDKTLVTIQTNGPFRYDAIKDLAHFEIPPKSAPNVQEFVRVVRHTKGNSEDTLTSDFLDVHFKRQNAAEPGTTPSSAPVPPKKAPAPAPAEPASESQMEIDSMHAWGESIALSSDQESLYAYGKDLVYDAGIKQIILKGMPMHAVKEGNLIKAPELIITHYDDKLLQTMQARGPGIVGMGDFDPKTQEHCKQAHWRDWLVVTKEMEKDHEINIITLTGSAEFIDTVNNQKLDGRQIKLWLLGHENGPVGSEAKKDIARPAKASPTPVAPAIPVARTTAGPEAPKKAAGDGKIDDANKARPRRIEAVGDVALQSEELIVNRTDYLNVWFKDIEAPPALPGAATGTSVFGPAAPPRTATASSGRSQPPQGAAAKSPAGQAKAGPAKKAEEEKKNPPIIVRHADRIEMWVNRSDGHNDLDKVHTVGRVVIHQDPSSENENGVNLAGNTVDLEHYLEGNLLLVTGNDEILGEVHFDKIDIIGDDIRIDQRDNTANVKGHGSMRMQSQASLIADGDKAKPQAPKDKPQPPKYIVITWNERMELEGAIRSVRYEGGVQAVQDDGRILCEVMQVWLDRPLYLNQAAKPKDGASTSPRAGALLAQPKKGEPDNSPKVEQVLCDKTPATPRAGVKVHELPPVSIEDREVVEGVLKKIQSVLAPEVQMDNRTNRMKAVGPGVMTIWQLEAKDSLAEGGPGGQPKTAPVQPAPNSAKAGAPRPQNGKAPAKSDAEQEMWKTCVWFDNQMLAFNNEPKHAVFRNNVQLVRMPSPTYDSEIDIARLPERSLYLSCREKLEVTTQTRQERDKNGKEIEVKWQEMRAEGDVHVRSDDINAASGIMTYSEQKSLLIFYGTPKNPASVTRIQQKGSERQPFRAEKITYNVKTKDIGVEGSIGGGAN